MYQEMKQGNFALRGPPYILYICKLLPLYSGTNLPLQLSINLLYSSTTFLVEKSPFLVVFIFFCDIVLFFCTIIRPFLQNFRQIQQNTPLYLSFFPANIVEKNNYTCDSTFIQSVVRMQPECNQNVVIGSHCNSAILVVIGSHWQSLEVNSNQSKACLDGGKDHT